MELYSGGYCGENSRIHEIKWSYDSGPLVSDQLRRDWLQIPVGDRRLMKCNLRTAMTEAGGLFQPPIIQLVGLSKALKDPEETQHGEG